MTKKIICDGCGVEITPPVPYSYRMRAETQYTDKYGQTKYRKVFRTFDFCSEEHFYDALNDSKVGSVSSAEISVVSTANPGRSFIAEQGEGDPVGHKEGVAETESPEPEKPEKLLVCPDCGRRIKDELSLKIHRGMLHKVSKP